MNNIFSKIVCALLICATPAPSQAMNQPKTNSTNSPFLIFGGAAASIYAAALGWHAFQLGKIAHHDANIVAKLKSRAARQQESIDIQNAVLKKIELKENIDEELSTKYTHSMDQKKGPDAWVTRYNSLRNAVNKNNQYYIQNPIKGTLNQNIKLNREIYSAKNKITETKKQTEQSLSEANAQILHLKKKSAKLQQTSNFLKIGAGFAGITSLVCLFTYFKPNK